MNRLTVNGNTKYVWSNVSLLITSASLVEIISVFMTFFLLISVKIVSHGQSHGETDKRIHWRVLDSRLDVQEYINAWEIL